MDGSGSETSKRQRLDSYNVSHRLQQQPPSSQSHNYSVNTLPPPNSSYIPQPLPPSPYHESASNEHRNLPDPTPHGYTQSPSGHNTPIRDPRPYPVDPSYSRRGSASGSTRSPDGYQTFPTARPLSTAAGNEGQHYPQQYPIENAGHFQGYPNHDGPLNGNPHHGLPMSNYSEPSHPNAPGHPSDYNPSAIHAIPHPYGSSAYATHLNHQNMHRPKKGNRATQACDICRTRKAKCDEGRPSCGFCAENSMTCNYQTVAPAKADRANQAILDRLDTYCNEVQEMRQGFLDRFDNIESLLVTLNAHARSSTGKESKPINADNHPSHGLEGHEIKPAADQTIAHASNKKSNAVDASPSGSHATVGTESSSVGVSAVQPVEVAIEHTTAAHRLLRWLSIKALLSKSKLASNMNEDYVMTLEESRGLLRLYGIGEGHDAGDGGHPSSPANSSNSARSDETPDVRSPASSSDGLWGAEFADARPTSEIGGLKTDGTLIVDTPTLRRLLQSYLDNIHILHPFLNKPTLHQMVETFAATYNPDRYLSSTRLSTVKSAPPQTLDGRVEPFGALQKPGKRKHSDGHFQPFASEPNGSSPQPVTHPPLERKISNAIVLLVMALGNICEWHEDLPGPLSPLNLDPSSPCSISIRQSPISSTQSVGNPSVASPLSGFTPSSRRMNDDSLPGKRNVEIIPGLAYYAQATDIMGNLHGGNDLAHVQASLLAGLYASQLARTFESWTWINSACRACRYLVRDPTLAKESDARADLIRFAFWTCSQLESDILAELDLPRSGIQDVCGVSYPKGFLDQADFGDMNGQKSMMFYYSGQIHIRTVLNQIQSTLHPPEHVENATQRIMLRDSLNHMLEQWRTVLPDDMKWNDGDEPAADINDARLRAKYYGAMYIVHRPFLRHALDSEIQAPDFQSPRFDSLKSARSSSLGYSNSSYERRSGNMGPPRGHVDDQKAQTEILNSARVCVQAAMSSTIAFDSIIDRQRLIVTNIFGTAHAQFGNIMVLATTYMSKALKHLVPRDRLEKLFDRTIKFLRKHHRISATLDMDANILETIRLVVFKEDDFNRSFSSTEY